MEMTPAERSDFLLQPLRKVRDYGKVPKPPRVEENIEESASKKLSAEEENNKRNAEAEAERGASMMALGRKEGQDEFILAAPVAPRIDIDYSIAEKRSGAGEGLGAGLKKACRLERFVDNLPVKSLAYLLNFLDGPTLGGLTTASKTLYMRVKSSSFTLQVTLKSLAFISGNLRRGVGYGMLHGCKLSVGVPDERCEVKTVTGITHFLTSAYPMDCQLERLVIQMDESVNDTYMHGLVSALSQKHANNLRHLSFEGCGLLTKGIKMLCDIMKKGSLKQLVHLDISRNNCQYGGVHKLAKVLAMDAPGGHGFCPNLKHINISGNGCKHALLDFFDRNFAKKTPFLTELVAQSNQFDIYDPDVVAQVRSLLTEQVLQASPVILPHYMVMLCVIHALLCIHTTKLYP